MVRLLKILLYGLVTFFVIGFCLANMQTLQMYIFPSDIIIEIPSFILVLFSMMVGVLLAGIYTFYSRARANRKVHLYAKKIIELENALLQSKVGKIQ